MEDIHKRLDAIELATRTALTALGTIAMKGKPDKSRDAAVTLVNGLAAKVRAQLEPEQIDNETFTRIIDSLTDALHYSGTLRPVPD